jgi:hypothetical protein
LAALSVSIRRRSLSGFVRRWLRVRGDKSETKART